MTKKLRNKFIWITMSILTVMLCIILSMIYFFTKMNLENNSLRMMQDIAINPFLQRVPNDLADDMRLPYFTLQISPQGDLIAAGGGYYDLSDEDFLEDLQSGLDLGNDMCAVHQRFYLFLYDTDDRGSSSG